jgi:hypothetical protein
MVKPTSMVGEAVAEKANDLAKCRCVAAAPQCSTPQQGCGCALTSAQVAKDARACSDPCRARAHRARRKVRRLAEIDGAIKTLQELRADVARAP